MCKKGRYNFIFTGLVTDQKLLYNLGVILSFSELAQVL